MYFNHQKAQQEDCLICQAPLYKSISFSLLMREQRLCRQCLSQFQRMHHQTFFMGYPLQILYFYNTFFRSLLYQYKGLYDYALKDAFLPFDQTQLARRYHDHVVVVIPSSDADNQRRGFAPVCEIARTFSSHVYDGLYKSCQYKQSSQPYVRRQDVRQILGIRGGELLRRKKVLLFDDVITSGQTLKQAVTLVKSCEPLTIELLVLATRRVLQESIFPDCGN